MCTTVRRILDYQRVRPSAVSDVPAQASTHMIPRNSKVSAIVFILTVLEARAMIRSKCDSKDTDRNATPESTDGYRVAVERIKLRKATRSPMVYTILLKA